MKASLLTGVRATGLRTGPYRYLVLRSHHPGNNVPAEQRSQFAAAIGVPEGGPMQAMGQALIEHLRIEDGAVTTPI